jgi:hypothetical protein
MLALAMEFPRFCFLERWDFVLDTFSGQKSPADEDSWAGGLARVG